MSAGSIPMADPLAYFLTWTTYGTWLPGDERGWCKRTKGFKGLIRDGNNKRANK
jgi:hypothetical protein